MTPMTVAELTAAVAEPAAAEGVSFESALEAEIVAEMAMHPASLPLLQFALVRVVRAPGRRQHPRCGGPKMGGIDGAIVARAEALFADLDPGQQAECPSIVHPSRHARRRWQRCPPAGSPQRADR